MVDTHIFWGGMFVSLWVAMFFVFSIRQVARSYPKPASAPVPAPVSLTRERARAPVAKA
jgi:hypothetical protein